MTETSVILKNSSLLEQFQTKVTKEANELKNLIQ